MLARITWYTPRSPARRDFREERYRPERNERRAPRQSEDVDPSQLVPGAAVQETQHHAVYIVDDEQTGRCQGDRSAPIATQTGNEY